MSGGVGGELGNKRRKCGEGKALGARGLPTERTRYEQVEERPAAGNVENTRHRHRC